MADLAFILAGFLVGTIVGLTGVGGGSLMTPLLIFGFGIQPRLAVGTDLLFAAITKFGGTLRVARDGLVDWPIVARVSAGSIPAALATVIVLHQLGPADAATQRAMTTVLGWALGVTALATLYKAVRHSQPARAPHASVLDARRTPGLATLFGAVVGVLVTLTSVGAGAIGVAVLMLLYPRLPLARVVGADIAIAVPLTLVAGLGHATLGSVDAGLLVLLLCGSLPGIWLGARLVRHAPDRLVRALLAPLLAYAGFRLINA